MNVEQQHKKRKNPLRWLTREQFSFVDMIMIYVFIQFINYVLDHLHWS